MFLTRLLSVIGSFASMLGLYFYIYNVTKITPLINRSLLAFGVITFISAIIFIVKDHNKNSPKRIKKNKIRDYMFKWISNGSKVVIFTRDISWVKDDDAAMIRLLERKAEDDELCICVPKITRNRKAFLDSLRRKGAKICDYPKLNYTPESRFTIVNDERMDSRVAVGTAGDGVIIVQEFKKGGHPFFHVAEDLSLIIKKFSSEFSE